MSAVKDYSENINGDEWRLAFRRHLESNVVTPRFCQSSECAHTLCQILIVKKTKIA